MKLQAYDLSYFVGKTFFRCDDFQNIFVYQATLDRLELKKEKGIDYVSFGNQIVCILLNLNYCILLSCIA